MRSSALRPRAGLVLLLALLACNNSKISEPAQPPGINLSLLPTATEVPQGKTTDILVTVTRLGGFAGAVDISVTGGFFGVFAEVTSVLTVGAKTTALVHVTVAKTTDTSPFSLTVHATAEGVTEKEQKAIVTVTPDDSPLYGTFVNPSVLSTRQGTRITTTVQLFRRNFLGVVTLSVDNLPAGVTYSFQPASPLTESETVLTLTVGSSVPPGTYSLVVRGTTPETSIADQVYPLTLTVTAPGPSPGH